MENRFFAITAIACLAVGLHAADTKRAGSWEMYLGPQYNMGKTLNLAHENSAKVNSSAALLFGFAYNFDEHISLGFMFNSTSANYKVSYRDEQGSDKTYSNSLYTSAFDLTAAYNFMEGAFTPYVMADLGMTYIDSGIPTGEEGTGCWWDPWYGYICAPVMSTYSANKLNYGAQLGLRYDTQSAVFFKAGIGLSHVDLDGTGDDTFTLYNVLVGFKFR